MSKNEEKVGHVGDSMKGKGRKKGGETAQLWETPSDTILSFLSSLIVCDKTEKPSVSFRGTQKQEEGGRKGGSKQGRTQTGREVPLPDGSIVEDICVNCGKN